jgi:MinD-like ATPase involved in chromosome partitioning or flagellar assembly
MTLRPHIFTFYSYKGGVGRSMALLNVAYTLHSLGRHVLVVDLDLEAPGVSGFLRRNEELAPSSEDQPDVVDLMSDLMPALQWGFEEGRPELPVLEKYLRSVRADGEKYAPARNPRFRRTRLDVLCASDERDYAGRLGMLDLSKLSGEELVGAGNLLREVFFSHQFPWAWEETEEDQPTRYDYILIDSRTGFTETSGLCIGPLADRLVLFCGLNDQNINGTAQFLKVVGLEASSTGEKWDDDDEEDGARSASLGQKPTLLVASPVPFGEMEMKAARFAKMEETLGAAPDARISYHPRLSILETVFCRDGVAESINQEYEDITMRLLAMVGDHPDQWERRNKPLEKDDALGLGMLKRMASLLDEENLRRFASPHTYLADQLSDYANQKSGAEADAFFAIICEKYEAALTIKPDLHEALMNWGTALNTHARRKSGAEADALFAAAVEKYEAALAIKPDIYEALYNWGIALSEEAKRKTGAEADALFATAGEKYEATLAIKPDKHEALYNLACLKALNTDVNACLAFLVRALERKDYLTQEKLDQDTDFDQIRAEPAFVAFRESLPAKE